MSFPMPKKHKFVLKFPQYKIAEENARRGTDTTWESAYAALPVGAKRVYKSITVELEESADDLARQNLASNMALLAKPSAEVKALREAEIEAEQIMDAETEWKGRRIRKLQRARRMLKEELEQDKEDEDMQEEVASRRGGKVKINPVYAEQRAIVREKLDEVLKVEEAKMKKIVFKPDFKMVIQESNIEERNKQDIINMLLRYAEVKSAEQAEQEKQAIIKLLLGYAEKKL